jgi:GntR family transcriptional regulator
MTGSIGARSTSKIPVWEVLKEYVADQIMKDVYPVGGWLPSVRALSEQVHVNRNTVSKAYRSLGQDGIVESTHGKGVRVTRKPVQTNGARLHLEAAIENVVKEAAILGLGGEWVLERVQRAVDDLLSPERIRMAFVECNAWDAKKLATDLEETLKIAVTPLELRDVSLRLVGTYDLVITTFFHYQEITAILPKGQIEIFGIHHTVSHDSILQVARIAPRSKVVIVCPNDRTIERVKAVVTGYTDAEYRAFTPDAAALENALRAADVAIGVSSSQEVVAKLAPDLPSITVSFQTEPQSLEALRERIIALSKNRATGCVRNS